MTGLTVSSRVADARAVLSVAGDLDLATLPELREAVQRALSTPGLQHIELDMTGLTFIDSSGLGLLVGLRKQALTNDVTLRLRDVPSGAARIIGIAGLAETFGLPPGAGDRTSAREHDPEQ